MEEIINQIKSLEKELQKYNKNYRVTIFKPVTAIPINNRINYIFHRLGVENTRSRKRENIPYRQVLAYYLSNDKNNYTLESIGKSLGNYHHSTIINSIVRVKGLLHIKDSNTIHLLDKIKNIDLEFNQNI